MDRDLIQFLAIVAISLAAALFNWLKKRSQRQDEFGPWPNESSTPAPPSPPAKPPPAKQVSWEEELRRLLEGEPAAPPPVIAPPALPPVARIPPVPPALEPEEEPTGLPVHLRSLTQSAQIYARASQLDLQVAERFRQVSEQLATHKGVLKERVFAPEIAQAMALVRNPQTLRTAVIASVILGPPKALEN